MAAIGLNCGFYTDSDYMFICFSATIVILLSDCQQFHFYKKCFFLNQHFNRFWGNGALVLQSLKHIPLGTVCNFNMDN